MPYELLLKQMGNSEPTNIENNKKTEIVPKMSKKIKKGTEVKQEKSFKN